MHHLGIALGGRPGAAVAKRLCVRASKDTLLRTVRRRATKPSESPRVIGIDDWAWRKGHRYGTVICDLARRVVVDLLPDREPATVAAWLARMPTIEIIARDRGGGYGAAATKALPAAIQVADSATDPRRDPVGRDGPLPAQGLQVGDPTPIGAGPRR